jgi:hypothetical protein
MTRRVEGLVRAAAVAAAFAMSASSRPVQAEHDGGGGDQRSGAYGRTIVMRDDCDPDDPEWDETGGCSLRRGDVDVAEFTVELASPLSTAVIGHQAWRNDPPYLKVQVDQDVRVRNYGGRVHTFTEVANFGGGRVPPLNMGLTPAPECATATDVPPGGRMTVKDLGEGNHRFQCCIHPWMRAIIKVKPDDHRRDR